MSKLPTKHSPDQPLKAELVNKEKQTVSRSTSSHMSKSAGQYHPSMNFDPLSNMPGSFVTDESIVDAASEKDLGNDYFKQKKFNEAIGCYSRSIALSPTAVAFSNRAMAYLKIKRFQEAENDCTEALNLDDRYMKACSHRATARKELGKLRDSLEDVEFALRLEPDNEELKKQRSEVKSLLEKAILAKAAGTTKKPTQVAKEVEEKVGFHVQEKGVASIPDGSKKVGVNILPDINQVSTTDTVSRDTTPREKIKQQVNGSHEAAVSRSHELSEGGTYPTSSNPETPTSVGVGGSRHPPGIKAVKRKGKEKVRDPPSLDKWAEAIQQLFLTRANEFEVERERLQIEREKEVRKQRKLNIMLSTSVGVGGLRRSPGIKAVKCKGKEKVRDPPSLDKWAEAVQQLSLTKANEFEIERERLQIERERLQIEREKEERKQRKLNIMSEHNVISVIVTTRRKFIRSRQNVEE